MKLVRRSLELNSTDGFAPIFDTFPNTDIAIIVDTEKLDLSQIAVLAEMTRLPILKFYFFPTTNSTKQNMIPSEFMLRYELRNEIISACLYKENNKTEGFYISSGSVNQSIFSNNEELNSQFLTRFLPDFLITNIANEYGESSFISPKVSFDDFMDRVRLLLTANHIFKVDRVTSINEGWYFMNRAKSIFWRIGNCKTRSEFEGNAFHSLNQRTAMAVRAIDHLMYEALKTPNNDTTDNALYHFGYLVTLITGSFEDLAAIFNHRFNLGFDKRHRGLRNEVPANRKYLEFLTDAEPKVASCIFNKTMQAAIQLIYPLRNDLQHNDFTTPMSSARDVKGRTVMQPSIIPISAEILDSIESIYEKIPCTQHWGIRSDLGQVFGKPIVEMMPFAMSLFQMYQWVINTLLTNIAENNKFPNLRTPQQLDFDRLSNSSESLYFSSYWLTYK